MKKEIKDNRSDLEECRDKIKMILREYNCRIYSADEYYHTYMVDMDTDETVGDINP